MNIRRWSLVVAAMACVVVPVVWWRRPPPEDPQIQRVQAIGKQLAELPMTVASKDERRELFTQLRTEVDQMSPEQRKTLMAKGPPPFARQMFERIDKYFELPVKERKSFLDTEIKRMELMRSMMPGPPGGPGGPNGPGGPGREMTSERRAEMQKSFLNATTPEQRAKMSEFFEDVRQRRQELGMKELPAPPF